MKKCSNCFQLKPLTDFYVKRAQNSYQSRCKKCNPEVCKAYAKRRFQRDFSDWVKNATKS